MSENITIGFGDTCDNTAVVNAMNDAFCPIRSDSFDFFKLLPKLYTAKYNPALNNVVAKENGSIKAAIGLYYNTVHIGSETLKTAGIGNVAVIPEARGKGYMKDCMNFALEHAKKNADFGFLDGQRQRYGYFSYDRSGICNVITLTQKNLCHTYGKDYSSTFTLKAVTAEDTELLDSILSLYNSGIYRFERSRESLYDILVSWCSTPYVILDGERFIGYFILNEEKTYISELKLCDYTDTENAIKALGSVFADRIMFRLPDCESELISFLSDIAETCVKQFAEMISVFNYENTIRVFMKLKASYCNISDFSYVFLIHGIAGDEKLAVSSKSNTVTVEKTEKTFDFELSHNEALRLFFSYFPHNSKAFPPEILLNLPLPIFIYSADNV